MGKGAIYKLIFIRLGCDPPRAEAKLGAHSERLPRTDANAEGPSVVAIVHVTADKSILPPWNYGKSVVGPRIS